MSHNPLVSRIELGLSEKSKQVQEMFDRIAPRYDLLNRMLSARQDVRWRNVLVAQLPQVPAGCGVLYDVACGTGDVMFQVERKRPDYTVFKGFDISARMLECACQRAEAKQKNFQFVQASAEKIPAESESANAVSISFGLRNVDVRSNALAEFYRVLKPGGRLLVLEFFEAESTFFAKIFDFYFKNVLPRIGGLFSDRAAYEYLPRSVATMPSAAEFNKMLLTAGFAEVTETRWLAGATRLFVAQKKMLPPFGR